MVSAISERHEQDGKTLSLAYQSIRGSERASCDPAMAVRTLPGAGGGPMPSARLQFRRRVSSPEQTAPAHM